jgi:heat shock protein HslJ
MLGRLVAPALPNRFGGEAPGVAPVFGQDRRSGERHPSSVTAMIESDDQGPTATSDALAGTEWVLRSIDGQRVVGGDGPILIVFGHDGRVSGNTGVNQLTASYSLTPDYVTFGPLATTRRAGPPELMEQEHRVVASLAGMCSYRLEPYALTLEGPLGRVELLSTTPPPPPEPPPTPPTPPSASDSRPNSH